MTGDLCNLVFGQIIHWIISVLLSKIKTEVLVLGERKLGVKRNSRVSKEVGLLGAWGFFCFVFSPPWFIFLLCFIVQPHTWLYRHIWGAASCGASAGTGRRWGYTAARSVLPPEKTCCAAAPCVSFLWVLCVFSEMPQQPCTFTCRFCLCSFKLNHEQKDCTLSNICDRALSVELLWLVLKMLWLFLHCASSTYQLCDWPWYMLCMWRHQTSLVVPFMNKGDRKKR